MSGTRSESTDQDVVPRSTSEVPARSRSWWWLVVPAAGLVFETVVLALAQADAPDLSHLAVLASWLWTATPFVLTGVLMRKAAGTTRVAWRLTVGLAVAVTLAGVGGYVSARLSTTASLVLLSGPLVQDGAVAVVAVVVLVLRAAQRRRFPASAVELQNKRRAGRTSEEERRETPTLVLGLLAFCTGVVVVLLALLLGFSIEATESDMADSAKGHVIAVPAVVAILTGIVALTGRRHGWALVVGWTGAAAAVVAVALTVLLPGG